MMRLSTMWLVDRTIDAEGRSLIADEVAQPWTPDPGWPRFFRSSANFVYELERDGAWAFLRFAAGSERQHETIDAEVRLVDRLAGAGLPVARPIPSGRGNLVETVETVVGIFHGAVFQALEGEQVEIDNLGSDRFRLWGAALGRLHAAIRSFTAAEHVARPSWRDQLNDVWSLVAGGSPAVHRELTEITTSLDTLRTHPSTYGLIHGDFELDNLVWRGEVVQAMDFDDAAYSWYAADIAFALGDLFADGFDATNPSFRAFVDGYAAEHPFDPESIKHISLFLRLGELTRYARITRALDLPASDDHPAWLTDLTAKLRDRGAAYVASLSA